MSQLELKYVLQINDDLFKRVCVKIKGMNAYEEFYMPSSLSNDEIASIMKSILEECSKMSLDMAIDNFKKRICESDFK